MEYIFTFVFLSLNTYWAGFWLFSELSVIKIPTVMYPCKILPCLDNYVQCHVISKLWNGLNINWGASSGSSRNITIFFSSTFSNLNIYLSFFIMIIVVSDQLVGEWVEWDSLPRLASPCGFLWLGECILLSHLLPPQMLGIQHFTSSSSLAEACCSSWWFIGQNQKGSNLPQIFFRCSSWITLRFFVWTHCESGGWSQSVIERDPKVSGQYVIFCSGFPQVQKDPQIKLPPPNNLEEALLFWVKIRGSHNPPFLVGGLEFQNTSISLKKTKKPKNVLLMS